MLIPAFQLRFAVRIWRQKRPQGAIPQEAMALCDLQMQIAASSLPFVAVPTPGEDPVESTIAYMTKNELLVMLL